MGIDRCYAWPSSDNTADVEERAAPLTSEAAAGNAIHYLDTDDPDRLIELVANIQDRHRPAEVLEVLEPLRTRHGGQSSLWHVLGRAYRQLGQRTATVEALRKASALAPRNPHLAIELARALMENDGLAEARAIFDRLRDEGGDGTPGWLVGFQSCNVLTGDFGDFEDVMSSIQQLPQPQRRLVKAEIMDEVARISAKWEEPEPEAPARADLAVSVGSPIIEISVVLSENSAPLIAVRLHAQDHSPVRHHAADNPGDHDRQAASGCPSERSCHEAEGG